MAPRKKKPKPPPLEPLDELLNQEPIIPAAVAAPALPTLQGSAVHRLLQVVREIAVRRAEALALYEPLPNQLAFHNSTAHERLLRGSVRGGKTLPAAVEVARAMTGQDPTGKYPPSDGRVYMVAPTHAHVADVIYPKLFRARPFKMVRDQHTNLWRAFRPWNPEDLARAKEAKPAPPLVPPRFVKSIAWHDKKRGVPSVVNLKTGWAIHFFAAEGDPQRGVDVDIVWFDEEVKGSTWYTEMAARLLDRDGVFIWSAAPQTGTQALFDLHQRAQRQEEEIREGKRKQASVVEFEILLAENPHIDQAQKDELREKYNEEEANVLIGGNYAILAWRVYPMFNRDRHGIMSFDVPGNWCHYAIIDPGHQVCAVLFVVRPPPLHPLHEHLIGYDELYIKQCTAEMFGEAMAPKLVGRNFEAFIIDRKGAHQSGMGGGKTIEMQYMEALQKRDLHSNASGHQFVWGSEDVRGRISSSKSILHSKADNARRSALPNEPAGRHEEIMPTFIYFKDVLAKFPWEADNYHNKVVNKVLTDEPARATITWSVACNTRRRMAASGWRCRLGLPLSAGHSRFTIVGSKRRRKKSGGTGQYVRLGPGTPGTS